MTTIPSLATVSQSRIFKSTFEAGRKPTIIRLRWLVITIAAYLLLFSQEALIPADFLHGFVLFYILSNACLLTVAERRFESMRFVAPLVVLDTVALTFTLVVTDQLGSDFYLSYFLMIIIAGFWKDFRWCLGFAVVLSVLYSLLLLIAESVTTSLMLRAPFVLIASVFYGYFVEVVNNEYELRQKAEREARHDFLTGLPNRQFYQKIIALESERAQRYRRPLSILLVDIDNFKLVNDAFGHDWGDVVLKKVARTLQSSLRKLDFAARFGGEEFIIILPETDLAGALETADRLRAAVRENPVGTPKGLLSVTVSIGASSNLIQDPADYVKMVSGADQALYLAKKGGKDRVVTANGTSTISSAGEQSI